MLLVKATYERMEVGRLNFIKVDEWFLVKDLNQLYDYIENTKHVTLIKAEIIKYTDIPKQLADTEFTCINPPWYNKIKPLGV